MRTMDQFSALVRSAPFLKKVGNAVSGNGVIALASLAAWGDATNASEADNRIAHQMNWLPTARDQNDPFYPDGLDSAANSEDALSAAKRYRMEIHEAVLARLQNLALTQLKAGPNNFAEAVKGAAAYAFRNAATEVALGIDGKWLQVAEIYFKGYWPCGILDSGMLVII